MIERTNDNMKKFNNVAGKKRFKEIKLIVKNIKYCPYCGTPVPKIKKEVKESSGSIKIVLEKEVGNVFVDEKTGVSTETTKIIKDYLSPRQCYNIFRNISDIDSYILGFNVQETRPEDLIITRFPIPPVSIRPTAKIDFLASSTMEDSLTLKIADIINSNIRVRNQMAKDTTITSFDTHTLLQYHIATYYDNDTASLPKSEFKRIYKVRVQGKVDSVSLAKLSKGITIEGTKYKAIRAKLEKQMNSNAWIIMELKEGKNREIRKICKHLGWRVNKLIRIQFGQFNIGKLKPGEIIELKNHPYNDKNYWR